MMKKISAQPGRNVDAEVGDFHANILFVRNPVYELVANESFRLSLFGSKLGTRIVEMRVLKGLSVNFGVVEKWRGVLRVQRVDDVEDELSQLVKKVEKDSSIMRKETSSSIVGY